MKIALRSLLLGLLMVGMSLAVAGQDIAVIQLRNRPAEDLQPLLLPMPPSASRDVPAHAGVSPRCRGPSGPAS